jgi:hypothetical protein
MSWGKLSMERNVLGTSCPWGKLSMGRVFCGEKCLWGEFRRDKLSMGGVLMGRVVHGRSLDEASCPWEDF